MAPMQIAPTLPPAAPAPAGSAAPDESGESGFAEMLKGEAARTPARDERVAEPKDAAEAAAAEEVEQAEPGAPSADIPLDPTLAQWLASLHMPPPEPRPATSLAADDTAADDGAPETGAIASTIAGTGGRGARALATLAERPGAEGRAAGKESAKAVPAAMTAGEESARPVTAGAAATSAPRQIAAETPLAAAPAAAPAATTPLAPPAAPVDVSLPMAPEAAGFGEAFATQVSVLARDGVQQAELHLNPAETGPVSIQIVLEGTQARIDFGADALPTRQAIEQSLPELAAALREQGLTLSGGGVSEHSRGREAQPSDAVAAGPARRSGDAAAAPVVHSVRSPRSAGGIDLYA